MTESLIEPQITHASKPMVTVTAQSAEWDTSRLAWNRAVDQQPAMVAYPRHAQDVADMIRTATNAGLRIAAQGTGHHAGALGTLANTILLRTDQMRTIDVDVASRRVRVGAGALWGEVTQSLAPHGLMGLAGSAADVGVTGYLLGGGYSWLAREFGVGCNSIVAAELVTGDGLIHRVDSDHEPDLLWAVKGGRGAVGIVTELEFMTYPVATIYAGMLLYPLEQAFDVFAAYGQWTQDLDPAATTCVRVLRLPPDPNLPDPLRGQAFVGIDGAINLPADQSASLLAPLRQLGPVIDSFSEIPGAELDQIHMDPPVPVPGLVDGLILDDLTDDAITALLGVVGYGADCPLLAVDVRHLQGAAGAPASDGGIVDHIPGKFLLCGIGVASNASMAQRVRRSIDDLKTAMLPWANDRLFSNFCEASPGSEVASRLYTATAAQRLAALREHHDPHRIFVIVND